MTDELQIAIQRVNHSGAYIMSTVTDTRMIMKTYYGYTKREALEMFKEHVKEEVQS